MQEADKAKQVWYCWVVNTIIGNCWTCFVFALFYLQVYKLSWFCFQWGIELMSSWAHELMSSWAHELMRSWPIELMRYRGQEPIDWGIFVCTAIPKGRRGSWEARGRKKGRGGQGQAGMILLGREYYNRILLNLFCIHCYIYRCTNLAGFVFNEVSSSWAHELMSSWAHEISRSRTYRLRNICLHCDTKGRRGSWEARGRKKGRGGQGQAGMILLGREYYNRILLNLFCIHWYND